MIDRIIGFSPRLITNDSHGKTNNFQYINFSNKYNLEKDTVSFSGKHKPPQTPNFPPRVQQALSVQSKLNRLYRSNNLSLENIQEVLSAKSPVPVTVKPMSELPHLLNGQNCRAYMQPVYEKDMKLSSAIIYLNPQFLIKREATSLISDCVHEYTHILQRHEDGDYVGLSKFTSNLEEARFLGFIAGHTMRDIEQSLLKSMNSNSKFTEIVGKKSKTLAPVTKEDIIPFLPKKEQIKENIELSLNANFQNTMDMFKVPKKYMGEYLFFFVKSKPYLEQSIIKQFEMESEAKQADIESRRTGLLPDYEEIFDNRINKSFYDAFLEIMK